MAVPRERKGQKSETGAGGLRQALGRRIAITGLPLHGAFYAAFAGNI